MSERSTGSGKSQQSVAAQTGTLKLGDGHRITYKSIGNDDNPLLLFVVGSSGLGALYSRLALELSSYFRCVYYDKRGFLARATDHQTAAKEKNPLVLAEQIADDAAALIKHLSPSQPAYVFGTSTGGTAVLDLTIRYPEIVHTVILHEPITFSVIRDDKLRDEMIAVYRKVGNMDDPVEGFAIFADYMFNPPQKTSGSQVRSVKGDKSSNSRTKSFSSPNPVEVYNGRQGHKEAIAMVEYVVDEQKTKNISDKLILVGGMESTDLQVSKPGHALSQLLGDRTQLWELAGDHMSFAAKSDAPKFCEQLLFVLHQEGRISLTWQKRQARM